MTLVAQTIVVEIWDGQTRQLSYKEIGSIVNEMNKMFGMVTYNPQTFQFYLDRYCRRKGIKPLITTDMLI